jgi:hypothetical protein
VRLDNHHIGSGPGTVIAHPADAAAYEVLIAGPDGSRDRSMRLWRSAERTPIGARVRLGDFFPGTGVAPVTLDPNWIDVVSRERPLADDYFTLERNQIAHVEDIGAADPEKYHGEGLRVWRITLRPHVFLKGST